MTKPTDPVSSVSSEKVTSDVRERAPNIPEFFGFQQANSVFSFDKKGLVLPRRLIDFSEPVIVQPKEFNPVTLPLVISQVKEVTLPLGLTIISGATATGKSRFGREIAMAAGIKRFGAAEPFDWPVEINQSLAIGSEPNGVRQTPMFSSADSALAAFIYEHYIGDGAHGVLIDSLRAPLFETSGPAGSKGVIMPFFTQLTRVSNQLARAGLTVIATVNPMNDESDFVASFLSKLSSSVPCTILLEEASRSGRYVGSFSSRPFREPKRFVMDTSSFSDSDPSTDVWLDIMPQAPASDMVSRRMAGRIGSAI